MSTPILLVLALSAPLAAQSVRVVDDTAANNPDFTTIQDAVNAASEGDVILVASGNYSTVLVDGKALIITADEGASVHLQAARVKNVPAQESVALLGLQIDTLAPNFAPRLRVNDCLGPVFVRDCTIAHNASISPAAPHPAVVVTGSARVAFSGCSMQGALVNDLGAFAGASTPALSTTGSEVSLHSCTLKGGDGRDGHPDGSGDVFSTGGAPAVKLEGGTIYVSGGLLQGGQGGDGEQGLFGGCISASQGGDGLVAGAAAAQIYVRGGLPVGGLGGSDLSEMGCGPGDAGTDIEMGGAVVHQLMGSAHPFVAPRVIRENSIAAIGMNGISGLPAILYIGQQPLQALVPIYDGVLLADLPQTILFLGDVPEGGVMNLQTVVRELPNGIEAAPIILQSAFGNWVGKPDLGDGAWTIVIDESF